MMRLLLLALLALAPLAPLRAQDTASAAGTARTLRERIEERFSARVQRELGLTEDQAARLRETLRTHGTRRRALAAEERRIRAALSAQLDAGDAANQDSVARLTEAWADLKVQRAESYRDEMREMRGYLTPSQRARFFILRERMLHRIDQARERRAAGNEMPRRRGP